MPRFVKEKNYVFDPNTVGRHDIWNATPSKACMRILDERSGNAAAQGQERKAGNGEQSDFEKSGDLGKNPKERLACYRKALKEYEGMAAAEPYRVSVRQKVLRVKGKIGNAHEEMGDALVKEAQKARGEKAGQSYERALKEYNTSKEMHLKCGDSEGSHRVYGKICSVNEQLALQS
ncbi:MAG: hypothetical protein WC861_01405 [Candidatus Micrarchaeia archaeon]|jgi:hypothetical protein